MHGGVSAYIISLGIISLDIISLGNIAHTAIYIGCVCQGLTDTTCPMCVAMCVHVTGEGGHSPFHVTAGVFCWWNSKYKTSPYMVHAAERESYNTTYGFPGDWNGTVSTTGSVTLEIFIKIAVHVVSTLPEGFGKGKKPVILLIDGFVRVCACVCTCDIQHLCLVTDTRHDGPPSPWNFCARPTFMCGVSLHTHLPGARCVCLMYVCLCCYCGWVVHTYALWV